MHEMPWVGMGGWPVMILWWVLIIAVVIFLMTWITKQTSRSGGKHSALNTLKERYARGEISKKEFEEKKRDIA